MHLLLTYLNLALVVHMASVPLVWGQMGGFTGSQLECNYIVDYDIVMLCLPVRVNIFGGQWVNSLYTA